jgi:hypothetical protein
MVKKRTHPVTLLKPDDPVSFSPFASATENCGYLLTCKNITLIITKKEIFEEGRFYIIGVIQRCRILPYEIILARLANLSVL